MYRYFQRFKEISLNFNKRSLYHSLREVTIFSGGNFAAQIIMMIYAILVARGLGPTQLGIYSGLYAIAGLSVTIVSWGLDTWMLREAIHYPSLPLLTGKVLSIKILFGSIWVIILWGILPLVRPSIFTGGLVFIVLMDVICDVLFNTIIASWNIEKKVKTISVMLLLSRLGKISLLIALIVSKQTSPISVAATRFVISGLVLLISLIFNKPLFFPKILSDFFQIIKSAASYGYSEILAVIYANVDVAILTLMAASTTVGFYSPASGIVHALFVIPNSIYSFVLPKYSAKFVKASVQGKKKDIRQIALYFSVIGLFMSIGLGLSGQFLVIHLLGSKYAFSGQLLLILSPILLFKSVEFGLAVIIVVFGYQRKRLFPQFIAAMISIFANILLLPYFGVIGVAWIYFLSELVLVIGYLIIVVRVYKQLL